MKRQVSSTIAMTNTSSTYHVLTGRRSGKGQVVETPRRQQPLIAQRVIQPKDRHTAPIVCQRQLLHAAIHVLRDDVRHIVARPGHVLVHHTAAKLFNSPLPAGHQPRGGLVFTGVAGGNVEDAANQTDLPGNHRPLLVPVEANVHRRGGSSNAAASSSCCHSWLLHLLQLGAICARLWLLLLRRLLPLRHHNHLRLRGKRVRVCDDVQWVQR